MQDMEGWRLQAPRAVRPLRGKLQLRYSQVRDFTTNVVPLQCLHNTCSQPVWRNAVAQCSAGNVNHAGYAPYNHCINDGHQSVQKQFVTGKEFSEQVFGKTCMSPTSITT